MINTPWSVILHSRWVLTSVRFCKSPLGRTFCYYLGDPAKEQDQEYKTQQVEKCHVGMRANKKKTVKEINLLGVELIIYNEERGIEHEKAQWIPGLKHCEGLWIPERDVYVKYYIIKFFRTHNERMHRWARHRLVIR